MVVDKCKIQGSYRDTVFEERKESVKLGIKEIDQPETSEKKNNIPAFPYNWIDKDSCGNDVCRESYPGMSLRDYFAAKSIVTIDDAARACKSKKPCWDEIFAVRADLKYQDADAMMKARGE